MNFNFGTIAPEEVLTFTHDFEATPEALYEAFTSAELIPQWFGPEGFTVPLDTVEIDVHEMSVAGWKSSFNKLNRVLAA